MAKMSKKQLKDILGKHDLYLHGKASGKQANLKYTNLYHADLEGVNLSNAKLHYVALIHAYLYDAGFVNADLYRTCFSYANLMHAALNNASLKSATLYGTNLLHANLKGADLEDANLGLANLAHADLRDTNLENVDLDGANLFRTLLDESEQYRLGTILKRKRIGYKKLEDGTICKLEIPKGAIVFCINGKKCRTNVAKVLEGKGASHFNNKFTYKPGKILKVKDFNLQYNVECASGIHFYWSRSEAERHEL